MLHDALSIVSVIIIILNCKMLRTLEINSKYSTSILRKKEQENNDKTN